jgi:transcription antitermination factor NusA-like protein
VKTLLVLIHLLFNPASVSTLVAIFTDTGNLGLTLRLAVRDHVLRNRQRVHLPMGRRVIGSAEKVVRLAEEVKGWRNDTVRSIEEDDWIDPVMLDYLVKMS